MKIEVYTAHALETQGPGASGSVLWLHHNMIEVRRAWSVSMWVSVCLLINPSVFKFRGPHPNHPMTNLPGTSLFNTIIGSSFHLPNLMTIKPQHMNFGEHVQIIALGS